MDLENSDIVSADVSRNYERLTTRFDVGNGVFIPAGRVRTTQSHVTYTSGSSGPCPVRLPCGYSGFYGGTLTKLTWPGVSSYPASSISSRRCRGTTSTCRRALRTTTCSARATYTLLASDVRLGARAVPGADNTVTTNARFRWEYLPGIELFVVYSDGRTTLNEGFPETQNRSFVVKATRLFRW